MNSINVRIENNDFVREDGSYNMDEALAFCGHIAGICYDEQGYDHVLTEDEVKTQKRKNMCMDNGHHSVFGHLHVTLYIKGLSKLLAMILNNENEYNASERSLRYTSIGSELSDEQVLLYEEPFLDISNYKKSIITDNEIFLYNKWLKIFEQKIEAAYPGQFTKRKIKTLSQENARAMVTVLMPTEIIYTTSIRQLNYIASWMLKFIENVENNYIEPWMYKYLNKDKSGYMNNALVWDMKRFLSELDRLRLLEPGLMKNEKNRKLSLFVPNLDHVVEYYGNVYSTKYKATFACIAQAQRHRTLDYQIAIPETQEFKIPDILMDDEIAMREWIEDISSVKDIIPIGQLMEVYESGNFDNFILKLCERLCSAAQLEVMQTTRDTLLKYKDALEKSNHPLALEIEKYTHGARCTFDCFECKTPCHFKEGIQLTRKI